MGQCKMEDSCQIYQPDTKFQVIHIELAQCMRDSVAIPTNLHKG